MKRRGFIASLFGGVAVAFGLRPKAPAMFTIVKNPRRNFARLFDEHGNPVHGSALREGDTIIAAEMTDA